jgi:hypothetical protein
MTAVNGGIENGHGVHLEFDGEIITPTEGRIRHLKDIPNIQTLEIPPIDYLVPGLIARNTITLWTGADGTAKTFLAQSMAIAVATGGYFLGRKCQSSEVLYLDYENPSFAIRDRLDLMTGGQALPGLHVWGTWLEQQPPQIGSELLLTIAKESRPLLFIDPFRYAHNAEENDSTEMMAVMQHLRYCATAGCGVVVLHHPAKAEGSTGRGSSCIKGAADVAFLQELSDESGLIALKCTKNRFGETHPITIKPNFDQGTFEVTDSPEFTKRTVESEKLLKIIVDEPGLSQNSIYKKAGMKKSRLVELLKVGRNSLWEEVQQGRSFAYVPIVPKTGNNAGNNGTGQWLGGCSSVPSSYKREQGTAPVRPTLIVPERLTEKPNGKALPSCPNCGSFAIYTDGSCQTCDAGGATC